MPSKASIRLILASASSARRDMLASAGLVFDVVTSNVDESAIRKALLAQERDVDPADIADVLAAAKAVAVSRSHPGALVVGADQILAVGSHVIGKARDLAEARSTLLRLSGAVHELHSAVALAIDGEVVWSDSDSAMLEMRDFSEAFIDDYLARAGSAVLGCVGCYQIEGLGVQLFEDIDGEYFTILGMPLLPLLAELRRRKVIRA